LSKKVGGRVCRMFYGQVGLFFVRLGCEAVGVRRWCEALLKLA